MPERLGDYLLLREIGHGGMGIVYEAEQVSLGRRVALKVLPHELRTQERLKQRFEREARAAARLHHTNIVPVFGVGDQDGLPYYVMQLIGGRGLDVVLREARQSVGFRSPDDPTTPFGLAQEETTTTPSAESKTAAKDQRPANWWQRVAEIGRQAAEGLDYAHRQGILHRDVKPANLLLDDGGTVWITDFGLARADDQQNLTAAGDLLGTLRYLPPEAFENRYDPRGDVYSLGLTLYELLAFRPAFEAHERPQLIKQVTAAEPPRLERLVPVVPRDLATIIHKAIEREPERRYPTAAELAADLQRFLANEPILARRTSATERLVRWVRRNPSMAGLVATLTLLLMVLALGSAAAALSFRHLAGEQTRLRLGVEQAKREVESHLYFRNLALSNQELAALQPQRAEALLAACAPDLRRWEWHLARRLCREGPETIVGRSGDQLESVAFHPDGRRLAVGGGGKQGPLLRLVDGQTGVILREFPGHGKFLHEVAFSPDGQRLGSASEDGTARLWDVESGRLLRTYAEHKQWVGTISFSPDGKRLATGSGESTVKIWDAETGATLQTITGPQDAVRRVRFSPDGRHLAAGSWDHSVYVWDIAQPEVAQVQRFELEDQVLGLAFNRDGTRLAAAGGTGTASEVRVWEVPEGKEIFRRRGHTDLVEQVAFSPDGRCLATVSGHSTVTNRGEVKLWGVQEGQEVLTLRGHGRPPRGVAFRGDGEQLATVGTDGRILLWDAAVEDRPFRSVLPRAFADADFNFAVLAPATWQPTTRTGLVVHGILRMAWERDRALIVAFVQPITRAPTIDELLKQSAQAIPPKSVVRLQKQQTLAGCAAVKTLIVGPGTGGTIDGHGSVPTSQEFVIIPRQRDLLLFLLTVPEARYAEVQPEFESMLTSLITRGAARPASPKKD